MLDPVILKLSQQMSPMLAAPRPKEARVLVQEGEDQIFEQRVVGQVFRLSEALSVPCESCGVLEAFLEPG